MGRTRPDRRRHKVLPYEWLDLDRERWTLHGALVRSCSMQALGFEQLWAYLPVCRADWYVGCAGLTGELARSP